MEFELTSLVSALQQTFSYLLLEATQIEGEHLKDLWEWVVQRSEQDPSARVVWLLIVALVFFGALFVLTSGLALFELTLVSPKKPEPKPSPPKTKHQDAKDAQEQQKKLAETIAWADKVAPVSVMQHLREGDISGAEKVLLGKRSKQPNDIGAIIYSLACRATRIDAAAYESLVEEIFPDGLNADEQICRHAAELGRLISPDRYPEEVVPQPSTVFEIDADSLQELLGPMTEFGNVKTLLDLVRIAFEMGETDQVKSLAVEILVCGNVSERKTALNYLKRLDKAPEA